MNQPSRKLYNDRNTPPLITIYDSSDDRSLITRTDDDWKTKAGYR